MFRNPLRSSLTVLTVCAGMGLAPRPAAARMVCDQPYCGPPAPSQLVEPSLPTNTLLWLGDNYSEANAGDWRLLDEQGTELPLRVHEVGLQPTFHSLFVAEPESELMPASAYTLVTPSEEIPFETQAGPDLDPPALPSVVKAFTWHERRLTRGCNGREHFGITANLLADPDLMLVTRSRDETGVVTRSVANAYGRLSTRREISQSNSGCYTDPGIEVGEVASLEIGVLDAAGNFSGWAEPVTGEIPGLFGCGRKEVLLSLALPLLLPAVGWRRRR